MKAALACALLLAGCAMGRIAGGGDPAIRGGIVVDRGGTATSWRPDQCRSGDRAYFAGFDFASSSDSSRLRAALNPAGPPAAVWTPAATPERSVVLRQSDCSVLDIAVAPTAWRVNDVREFAGHVTLRCTATDGTRFEGRIDVDHCH